MSFLSFTCSLVANRAVHMFIFILHAEYDRVCTAAMTVHTRVQPILWHCELHYVTLKRARLDAFEMRDW